MGVSIIDIAILAGVSKSTVSAVINNHPNVRPSTRERVLEAIRELDYHPNLAARELITASPMNIGIIMPTYPRRSDVKENKYFSGINESSNLELVSDLVEQVSQTRYGVLLEHTVVSDNEPSLPSFALSKRVSGIFQISPLLTAAYVQKLRQYVPAIVEIGALNPNCDSVYSDFSETVCRSVEYLADFGHSRIAFINCDPSSRTVNDRLRGYKKGLELHRMSFNDNWVSNSAFTGIGGYEAFKNIWESDKQKPTAVICASSTIACGAIRYMSENNISVPDDVSLICNSDGMLSEFCIPQLTTIGRNKSEIAKCAFDLMMERLKDLSAPARSIKIKDQVVERSSVKRI